MLDVSVVIVNYNVAPLLVECLRSVYASTQVALEVFVVDNCSTDDSVQRVRSQFPQAHLIETAENRGYAYANNLALKLARGEFVVLLNPDTTVPPDGLAQIGAFMRHYPQVGVVGPKLVRQDGSLDLACRRSFPTPEVSFYRMLGLSKLFPRSRRFGQYNLTYLDPDELCEVDSVCGAFMMVRRDAMEKVGLLDESFFMYGEDLDWALRFKQMGWRVVYNPGVVVKHYKGESSKQSKRKTVPEFYRAMQIFYKKHYERDTVAPLHWLIVSAVQGRLALARLQHEWLRRGQ